QKLGETLSMAFPLAAAVLGSGMNFSSFYTGDSSKVAGGAVDKPPVKIETSMGNIGNAEGWRDKLTQEAITWEGKIPYCLDSIITTQILDHNNPPPYMDCSDFTSSVYLTVLGIDIGRDTKTQIKRGVGKEYDELKVGDLILFDWKGTKEGVDHVGIYIGNGDFIHETGTNENRNYLTNPKQNVRIENLNDSWGVPYGLLKDNICAIRRIIQDDDTYINKKEDGNIRLSLLSNGNEPNSSGPDITKEIYEGVDSSYLGARVNTVIDLQNLSELDILARTIYGECNSGKSDYGQESVAWTIINRMNSGECGDSYKDVVLQRGQYAAVTGGYNETNLARNPQISDDGWKKAVFIAQSILNGKIDQIPNQIGTGMYFRSSDWFDPSNTSHVKNINGQYQLLDGKRWVNIKDVQTFSGNTYFNYGTSN
ncbi:NlpC/P60 family protein, partial [Paenibacillus sp. FSL H7-0331]